MKIYRISQEIIDYEVDNKSTDSLQMGLKNYLDIGHNRNRNEEEENDSILWAFVDGKIMKEMVSDINGHYQWMKELSPEGDFSFGDKYHGRYDPDNGDLSLSVPIKYRLRELPNILIKALNREFNPNKIHIF